MLKHCQATAADSHRRSHRSLINHSSNDSASLNSTSTNSFNSSFGSEDNDRRSSYSTLEPLSMVSRASSFASLSLDSGPKTALKIYANCLRPDIEYKTLCVGYQTTCKELIWMLLAKYKMKHRDPNLFYLTMDINIKRTGIPLKRTLVLEDDSKPAELKSCHPWGECKFSLQMRKGGLVRIHDSIMLAESKYKCLLISEHTTVEEVISILFHCYGVERLERVDRYCIYEECQSQSYERKLHPQDRPAQVQSLWPNQSQFHFVLRRRDPVNSVSVSPVSSEMMMDEVMDMSYTSTPEKSYFQSKHPPAQPASLPPFRMSSPPSIHESGLPPPPALRPKPSALLTQMKRASLGSLSSGSRSSFHDYENYFYI